MFTFIRSLFSYIQSRLLARLIPRPSTGSIIMDVFYLMVFAALQFTVIPSLIFFHHLDLMTIWLSYHFVVLSPGWALMLGMLGALIMENHLTVPAGTYLCIYWVLAVVFNLLRDHLSWRDYLPWISCFFVSQLSVFIFEVIITYVKTGDYAFYTGVILFEKVFANLLGIAFGLVVVQHYFINSGKELA